MFDSKVRAGWDRLVSPVGRGLARLGLSANVVTMLGVALQVVAAVLILQGHLMIGGFVAIAAAFADAFDGAVAKSQGTVSRFGGLLDSTTDRLTDALYFVPLAWLYGVDPDIAARDEPWIAAVCLAALVVSFMVSYIRAKAESLGFDCKVGIAERAERLILIIAGLILDIVPITISILLVAATITFFQRLVHVHRQATQPGAGQ